MESKPRWRLGLLTWLAITAGLAAFIILAVAGYSEEAALAVLYTPIAAATVTGVELIIRRHPWPGVSLLCAVGLIVGALLLGVWL